MSDQMCIIVNSSYFNFNNSNFLVLWDHGLCMGFFYILNYSSAHGLGDVSGVASLIAIDVQLQ